MSYLNQPNYYKFNLFSIDKYANLIEKPESLKLVSKVRLVIESEGMPEINYSDPAKTHKEYYQLHDNSSNLTQTIIMKEINIGFSEDLLLASYKKPNDLTNVTSICELNSEIPQELSKKLKTEYSKLSEVAIDPKTKKTYIVFHLNETN